MSKAEPSPHGYHLITVPNKKESPESVIRSIKDSLSNIAEVYRVELPSGLMAGTLDTLISLSDELGRVDIAVENVTKKIEKQYTEVAGRDAEFLLVNGVTPDNYIRKKLEWDYAKYTVRQPLTAIVAGIQSSIGKIEDELRGLSSVYSEKSQAVQALKRKKQANLLTADLNEVLTEDKIRGIEFVETEHLTTLVVTFPKSQEKVWLDTYMLIGADIASYGNPDWAGSTHKGLLGSSKGPHGPEFTARSERKGSPVVPGSSKKIMEDQEGCLYTVTILKGQYQSGFYDGENFQSGMQIDYVEAFKKAAKEKRFTVREFKFDPERAGEIEREHEQLTMEARQIHAALLRWCKAHFGEAMVAWMHIKLVRGFVESVLRYGLPVDFSTMIVEPGKGKAQTVIKKLDSLYAVSDSEPVVVEDKEKEDYHGFVTIPFTVPMS